MKRGIVHPDVVVVTENVTAIETEMATANDTAEEMMNDVTENAMVAAAETMILVVDGMAPAMTMTVVTAEKTEKAVVVVADGMIEGNAAVIVDEVEEEEEGVKVKKDDLPHQRIVLRSLSVSERRLGGTFMLPGMNSTLQCKQSKQVCSLYFLHHLTTQVFILSGLFNLPGANRTQIPPILSIPGLPPPMPVQSFGMGIGGNPNLSRQSRRLYIGSITQEVNEQNLADFFNAKMAEMNIGTGITGNPVLAVQCNYEKNYAFVEVSRMF